MGVLISNVGAACAEGNAIPGGSAGFPPGSASGKGDHAGDSARDEDDLEPWDTDELDTDAVSLDPLSEYVFEIGHLTLDEFLPKTQADCFQAHCPQDGREGDQTCAYVHYDETRHAHDFVAFQPNSATLWPGNIVQGDDAQWGLLTPIGLPRAPMNFSLSLENLGGSPVGSMEVPSLSSFREERNRILSAGIDGASPAQVSYSMHQVFDSSQVAVSLGASASWAGFGGISSMFEFENATRNTKILVDFTQAYYTIDVDTPGLPADLFRDDVTVQDLSHFTGDDNPPMYVQSITYGRRVIFAMESSYNAQAVRTAFDAGFNAFLFSGGIDLATEHRTVLQDTKISALVLGGSGSDAVKTVFGFEGLLEYLSSGGDFSRSSPGAPIAYKLAYLDNSGVKFAFSTSYAERQCYDSHANVTGELARLEHFGGSSEVFGWINFKIAPADEPNPCAGDSSGWQSLFDRSSNGAQRVSGIWVPTTPVQRTFYDFEVEEDAQLCIRGRLRSRRKCWLFCSHGDFGTASVGPIPLKHGWPGDHALEFSGNGTVLATVRISMD